MNILLRIINISFLFIISYSDLKKYKIPNLLVLLLFAVSFSYDIYSKQKCWEKLIIALLFIILFFIIYLITKGLGVGDIKLIFVIAYNAGFFGTIFICMVASFTGIFFIIFTRIIKKARIQRLPFAPLLTLGVCVKMLFLG